PAPATTIRPRVPLHASTCLSLPSSGGERHDPVMLPHRLQPSCACARLLHPQATGPRAGPAGAGRSCNPVGRRGGAAPWRERPMKLRKPRTGSAIVLACAVGLVAAGAHAETLDSSATGTHDGYYYTFWKDSGPASMTLHPGGRYGSQWTSGTNNWVGGKGWNPGGPRVVNYSGHYGVDSSQNS